VGEIIKEGDVALLRILVMKEKVIVMDQVMEVVMMGTRDVKEIFNVEAIIVESLVSTSMKKMTAVKNLLPSVLSLRFLFQELH
jgi:hypothetical protein